MSLNFVRDYFERRKIRKMFDKYVSREDIKRIERDERRYFKPEREYRHIQFVIVLIDESKPEEVSALLEKVVETCFRHWMILNQNFYSLVTAYLGPPLDKNNNPETRFAVVDEIVRECPGRVRMAHGECTGLIGNFGSEKRFAWGALIPNFLDILRKLLDAPMGTVLEIPEVRANGAAAAGRP
jgi:hypothetical protein